MPDAGLVARLRAHAGLKGALIAALAAALCVPYYAIQHVREPSAYVLSRTRLDDAVPYDERWIWVYLSLYGIMLVPPLLSRSRDALLRFATGFVALCVVSDVIFLCVPTAVAPTGIAPTDPAMRFVLSLDGQGNALPSLHASLAIYAALCTPMLVGGSRWISAAAWLWALAIAYATLPTRRHVVVDLVAGGALAGVVYGAYVCQRDPKYLRSAATSSGTSETRKE